MKLPIASANVNPDDVVTLSAPRLAPPTHGALFAGIGGWTMGLGVAGWRTLWACDIDPLRRAIHQRHHPTVNLYDDVTTMPAPPPVDLITLDLPDQALWTVPNEPLVEHAERIIRATTPSFVIVQTTHSGAAEHVVGWLGSLGYQCRLVDGLHSIHMIPTPVQWVRLLVVGVWHPDSAILRVPRLEIGTGDSVHWDADDGKLYLWTGPLAKEPYTASDVETVEDAMQLPPGYTCACGAEDFGAKTICRCDLRLRKRMLEDLCPPGIAYHLGRLLLLPTWLADQRFGRLTGQLDR